MRNSGCHSVLSNTLCLPDIFMLKDGVAFVKAQKIINKKVLTRTKNLSVLSCRPRETTGEGGQATQIYDTEKS